MSPQMGGALDAAAARMRRAGSSLPGVELSSWYGTPALKVGAKGFCRLKDADTLVVLCPVEEKALLMERAPDIYFETDHYKGWGAILVRLEAIGDEELAHRLMLAWRVRAPKRLLSQHPQGGRDEAG